MCFLHSDVKTYVFLMYLFQIHRKIQGQCTKTLRMTPNGAGARKKYVRNAYFVDLHVFYDGFDDLAGEGSSGGG